jgi:hypothetical protein
MENMREPISLLVATSGFYLLQALKQEVVGSSSLAVLRHRQALADLSAQYTEKLALAMRDYLTFACFGEARHAPAECEAYLRVLHHASSRREAAVVAVRYDWRTILEETESLFGDYQWSAGYGGRRWATIAQVGQLFGKVPDEVFVDHTVDLTHNGGLAFDKKDYGILYLDPEDVKEYKELLDLKAAATTPREVVAWVEDHVGVPSEVCALVFILLRDSLLRKDPEDMLRVLSYQPQAWGSVRLDCIAENIYWREDEEEEEEEEYDDEPEEEPDDEEPEGVYVPYGVPNHSRSE